MKIIYTPMEFDYGIIARGRSFEDFNFYDSLLQMGHEIIRYDCVGIQKEVGKEKMNKGLFELVMREQPDLVFFILFKDELDPKILSAISNLQRTKTLNWFCDDHWRFEKFSIKWAPYFNWVTTTDTVSFEKYRSKNYHNVILTQWACNHNMYVKKNVPKTIDISFVGQPYGERKKNLMKLRADGVEVKNWGFGSVNGRASFDEMIDIFNTTKINLNFSASYINKFKIWERKRDQIKARNFEIPGCGGFQLASYLPDIDKYLSIGNEIVCYHNYSDLVEKIHYYLSHDDEREKIATNGYHRIITEHTYEKRFTHIFNVIFS